MTYDLDPLLAAITDRDEIDDDDLDALRIAVLTEQERRRLLDTAPEQVAAVNAAYVAAIGRHDGDEYQPVVGAHDAYAPGSVVSAGGDYYRSTAWASHAPGTTGAPWERVWPDGDGWTTTPPAGDDGQPAAWMSGVAYEPGDRVTHDGQTWEAKITHTSHDDWKPSPNTHAVWTLIS